MRPLLASALALGAFTSAAIAGLPGALSIPSRCRWRKSMYLIGWGL
jgi:hypothetical protein